MKEDLKGEIKAGLVKLCAYILLLEAIWTRSIPVAIMGGAVLIANAIEHKK